MRIPIRSHAKCIYDCNIGIYVQRHQNFKHIIGYFQEKSTSGMRNPSTCERERVMLYGMPIMRCAASCFNPSSFRLQSSLVCSATFSLLILLIRSLANNTVCFSCELQHKIPSNFLSPVQ